MGGHLSCRCHGQARSPQHPPPAVRKRQQQFLEPPSLPLSHRAGLHPTRQFQTQSMLCFMLLSYVLSWSMRISRSVVPTYRHLTRVLLPTFSLFLFILCAICPLLMSINLVLFKLPLFLLYFCLLRSVQPFVLCCYLHFLFYPIYPYFVFPIYPLLVLYFTLLSI